MSALQCNYMRHASTSFTQCLAPASSATSDLQLRSAAVAYCSNMWQLCQSVQTSNICTDTPIEPSCSKCSQHKTHCQLAPPLLLLLLPLLLSAPPLPSATCCSAATACQRSCCCHCCASSLSRAASASVGTQRHTFFARPLICRSRGSRWPRHVSTPHTCRDHKNAARFTIGSSGGSSASGVGGSSSAAVATATAAAAVMAMRTGSLRQAALCQQVILCRQKAGTSTNELHWLKH